MREMERRGRKNGVGGRKEQRERGGRSRGYQGEGNEKQEHEETALTTLVATPAMIRSSYTSCYPSGDPLFLHELLPQR